MSIQMASLDHHSAGIALREKFSFTAAQVKTALAHIMLHPDVAGAVLLSTCNRTELYLSCKEGCSEGFPVELLCAQVGQDVCGTPFLTLRDKSAVRHLMEVACGLHSLILCEDQIITQVKTAATLAREEKASDAVLETAFRMAVTAAKKAKTTVRVTAVPSSSAKQAVDRLQAFFGSLQNKRALVIGNGEMGRLCASLLVAAGCAVTLTLRTYKHGETVVPFGCDTIAYDRRQELLAHVDLVISATTSPHYTLTAPMLADLASAPRCLVDLAVPRDIDPAISGIPCWNIDTLGGTDHNEVPLAQIEEILCDYQAQFAQWLLIHSCSDRISDLKVKMAQKISAALLNKENDGESDLVEQAVYRTVDCILYAAKGEFSPQWIAAVEQNIK